jgi:hypothetical protein
MAGYLHSEALVRYYRRMLRLARRRLREFRPIRYLSSENYHLNQQAEETRDEMHGDIEYYAIRVIQGLRRVIVNARLRTAQAMAAVQAQVASKIAGLLLLRRLEGFPPDL